MTCVVAITDGHRVWMGADSVSVSMGSLSATARKDPKIYNVGDALIGFTTSFRMGQVLGHHLTMPARGLTPVYDYMVTAFIDAVRKTLKDAGFANSNNGVESAGEFLVGFEGRVFHIYSDYQVSESALPFDAVGCGGDLALGALFASRNLLPRERVQVALEAAAEFSAGVRAPFLIKCSTANESAE